ncbi:MAG: DUF3575 domain-containing protein [Planctomycetota bacterium]|jgi:hypothetical protein
MRFGNASGLLLLVAMSGWSCNFIPPYSDIKEQNVAGFHTVKFRAAAYNSMDAEATDTVNRPPIDSTSRELDRFSSFGLEVERQIGNQVSATVSLDSREYHQDPNGPPIKANQIAAGMRKYFGSRAVTAFLTGQLHYNFGLDLQKERFESDGFLGWGVGTGINWAFSENFSVEAYLMYEGMADVSSHLKGDNATSSGFDHNLSGLVGYIAIGYHF